MRRKYILWLVGYFLLVFAALGFAAANTIHIDPFFHYHKPNTSEYFYPLDNQRSQNNGISKHFEYTGLITGTSMTENFKTSEAEALWGGSFIKVSYSGSSYKEINDNVELALEHNPNLRVVIRGLDMRTFTYDKDWIRDDLGQYPTYLYDDQLFNDAQYVFNRDVIFKRVYPMIKAKGEPGFVPGITSFDEYSNWMSNYKFGKDTVAPGGVPVSKPGNPVHITEAEESNVRGQIEQNLIAAAKKYPDVTFYYFFTPYSARWWMTRFEDGRIYRQVEAEQMIIEELLKYPNIKLFSFNCRFDLTTDLNNYKDYTHYGEWINSLMLRCMKNDQYLLSAENYQAYLEKELQFYTTYDYTQMNNQPDYDDDYYAAFLLAKEAYGLEETEIDLADDRLELQHAELVENQHNGKNGILCTGSIQRDYTNKTIKPSDYMRDTGFVGFKMTIDDITPYRYLE